MPTSANIACKCTTTPTLAQSCTCDRNQTPITQSICNVGPMIFAIWVPTYLLTYQPSYLPTYMYTYLPIFSATCLSLLEWKGLVNSFEKRNVVQNELGMVCATCMYVCYSVPPLTYRRTSFQPRVRASPSPDPNDRTTLPATNRHLNIFTVFPSLRLSLPLTYLQLATRHYCTILPKVPLPDAVMARAV